MIRNTKSPALSFDAVTVGPAPSGGVIANNVVWADPSGTALELGDTNAWTLANNAWSDGKPAADASAGSFGGDPGLTDPTSAATPEGFELTASSPCKSAGTAAPAVTKDFWCAPRSPTTPSIGVHEP